jgi:hypothetical protein
VLPQGAHLRRPQMARRRLSQAPQPLNEPYALLKPQMRYEAQENSLILQLRKHPILYRDYLAPYTLDRLNSTLQRPGISDDFRNQIQGILAKYRK